MLTCKLGKDKLNAFNFITIVKMVEIDFEELRDSWHAKKKGGQHIAPLLFCNS